MSNAELATQEVSPEIISALVLQGDLSKMNEKQKVEYYNRFCQSLGLNPLTQPFQIISFQGKQKLYAMKDCTEQLRKIHGVSIIEVTSQELRGVFVVTAKAMDKSGKTDASTGAVTVEGLKGDALANALMKAETKAKRRVTLSICGLGMLDESETDTMPTAQAFPVTETNRIEERPFAKKKIVLEKWTNEKKDTTTRHWKNIVEKMMAENNPITIAMVEENYTLSDEIRNELLEIEATQKQVA